MKKKQFHGQSKSGVSSIIFSITTVILIVVAAVGYGLYGTAVSHSSLVMNDTSGTSSTATTSMPSESSTEMMNHSVTTMMMNSSSENPSSGNLAILFSPQSGAMISNAWLLSAQVGMDEYAVSIHAEGLEPSGAYIVEGALASGSMQVVPVSSQSMRMNATSDSEFQANSNGTGFYWIVLTANPGSTFENFQLLFLPGMSMQNATLVATANLGTAMTESSSMTSMSP